MENALLIHGCTDEAEYYDDQYPSLSNSHWFPWLQKQLLMRNILAQTPEMPGAGTRPLYADWKREAMRHDLGPETLLLGHSCGAGFLLRLLGEEDIRAAKLILVAPWMESAEEAGGFLTFAIDPVVAERAGEVHVLHSKDDDVVGVAETVQKIRDALPEAKLHTFAGLGHFTEGSMGRTDFSELLNIVCPQE